MKKQLNTCKKSEKDLRKFKTRFKQVTDSITQAFWMTDPNKNQMLYISKAYETIWGRSCEELLRNPLSFIEAIHEEDRERVLAFFPQQPEGTYDIDYRITKSDGQIRWIRDKAFPIRDSTGNVFRITGVATDITELKKAQGEMIQARRETFCGKSKFFKDNFLTNSTEKRTDLGIKYGRYRCTGRIESCHSRNRSGIT